MATPAHVHSLMEGAECGWEFFIRNLEVRAGLLFNAAGADADAVGFGILVLVLVFVVFVLVVWCWCFSVGVGVDAFV